jgi:UDP-GlcNAc3NAcA epimerase
VKLFTVIGARPQFVKAAAVSRAIRERSLIREVLVHTGQHFDVNMSDVFFDELGIGAPEHNLGVHGGGHGDMTGRMLIGLEPLMIAEKPDMVLVYGDTNSTLAAALCAAKLNIPVAHVEAGLRSFNRKMPEEINRVVADHMSALLFCPTEVSVANLRNEGVVKGVHHVGDVMFDSSLYAKDIAKSKSDIVKRLGLSPGGFALATIHRAENTDDAAALKKVFDWLAKRALERPVILAIHPRTRARAAATGLQPKGVMVIDPVGPIDIAALLDNCAEVFTDSGGLQKEAYFFGKPCVTLRTETEWVETVDCGWNRLWSVPSYKPRRPITDYGTGDAARKIVDLLVSA